MTLVSPNEFITLRESLHLSPERLAKLAGFTSSQPIIHFENGGTKIPESIHDLLKNLDSTANRIANLCVKDACSHIKDSRLRPENYKTIALLYYGSDADLHFADAEAYEKLHCFEAYFAAIERAHQQLIKLNAKSKLVLFNRGKYETWLNTNEFKHSSENRIKWTMMQEKS
ncbi:MAG: hypothetical protein COV52_01675 [Gammaproteobacteria bacterium CG11_big_fil_rev_8_21_14_0_20_46_22]|nr:MAG: hypothetical protein COW05_05570 [Gammaproteobacteria bacterium CG12_big_fil_rev_8_21_14_0_65_46_12]PIR11823.1 MAG: hypothetical protein COV52_01675 [Gammaproteobacteria bacterium CG11_big_fil_rev_8_21_14_0_20_46_22]